MPYAFALDMDGVGLVLHDLFEHSMFRSKRGC